MSGGGSLHKKDWLKIAGGLGLGATGLGLAGIGPLAGLFAAGAEAAPAIGGGAAASMFGPEAGLASGLLAGSTPEAIATTAAGGAGLAGMGGASPFAAAPGLASGLLGTPTATASLANPTFMEQLQGFMKGDTAKALNKGFGAYTKSQAAINALNPQPQSGGAPMVAQRPQFGGGIIGQTALDQPPSTPYTPYDPLWVAYLNRHPQPQGATYG